MSETEAALARRLRRMRWLAGSLLLAMLAIFVSASVLPAHLPWLGAVRAFAEAAMVGALADWFAVTALFRRPFGLPIPHTAIVPNRKDVIGRALARFVGDHFLVEDAVHRRLSGIDLAAKLGGWLSAENSARSLSRDIATASTWLLGALDSAELRNALKASLRDAAQQVPVNTILAVMVDVLISSNHAQSLIDQLVGFGREQLERNRERIRQRIHERSPWWLPRFVDEEIYDQLVSEFERILAEVGENPDHEARIQFNDRLARLRVALREDSALQRGAALRDDFIGHPALAHYLGDLGARLRDYLLRNLENPHSAVRLGIEHQIRGIGATLQADVGARAWLNRWLQEGLVYLVENYRGPLSETISQTIAEWDASATAQRIELYIGRDLQFIRINGTVVGGLVGLAIYAISSALSV
jgi:uncharacterized membrane-anchored protein YjiN (DUF445 family)